MEALQHEDFYWPDMSEVVAFRAQVKEAVIKAIKEMPDPRECPITMESPYWSLVMGFEHERIHIETSSVLIHQLPIESVLNIPGWRLGPSFALDGPEDAPKNELVEVPETTVVLGKPKTFPSFGWDNEYGTRVVKVPSFKASAMLVSNAEFLPFVLVSCFFLFAA
jgi:formylglycine-generating enzyme required for sulfatase activity